MERKTNQENLNEGLNILHECLYVFVVSSYRHHYGENWLKEVRKVLDKENNNYLSINWESEIDVLEHLDVLNCLHLMDFRWRDVFGRLGMPKDARAWVNELKQARHTNAHRAVGDLDRNKTIRYLQTMEWLCREIDVGKAREITGILRRYETPETVSVPRAVPQRRKHRGLGLVVFLIVLILAGGAGYFYVGRDLIAMKMSWSDSLWYVAEKVSRDTGWQGLIDLSSKVLPEKKPEMQPETQPEIQTEARTEARTEAQTEARTEARTEAQTEAQTEMRTETQPETQTEEVYIFIGQQTPATYLSTEPETQTEQTAKTDVNAIPKGNAGQVLMEYSETAAEKHPEPAPEEDTRMGDDEQHDQLPTASCFYGDVTIELLDVAANGRVDVRITNRTDGDVVTFGLPSVVINGRGEELNWFDNMSSGQVTIPSGAYMDIVYNMNPAVYTSGGQLKGQLWSMNPTVTDRFYDLEIPAHRG